MAAGCSGTRWTGLSKRATMRWPSVRDCYTSSCSLAGRHATTTPSLCAESNVKPLSHRDQFSELITLNAVRLQCFDDQLNKQLKLLISPSQVLSCALNSPWLCSLFLFDCINAVNSKKCKDYVRDAAGVYRVAWLVFQQSSVGL